MNERERLVCEVFAKVLGLETVDPTDDFFRFGENSIGAIKAASMLQKNFNIKPADIFELRTPEKIAASLLFGDATLRERLEQIKLEYKNIISKGNTSSNYPKEIKDYFKSIHSLQIDPSLQKPIVNALLTGAPGYLGCNLLNQLLKLTDYNIFVLVRAKSHVEAIQRIKDNFLFYFDNTLDGVYAKRVFIIKADLEEDRLGLTIDEYQKLVTKIDSVIHAAAIVKLYGDYAKFYSANVQATINMLEFTKLTKNKDFHYISTNAVLNYGLTKGDKRIRTEDDVSDDLADGDNVYIKTKLLGEHQIINYRNHGIKGNIYRLGNLAFMLENHRLQDNVASNAFYNWCKCLFVMKCIAREFSKVEISPVDYAAQAIVKLFNKKQLCNNIFHVFNHHLLDLSDMLDSDGKKIFKILSMEEFIDKIADSLNYETRHELITRFILRQGWLDGWDIKKISAIKILQNRSQHILEGLGFSWFPITSEMFTKYTEVSNYAI